MNTERIVTYLPKKSQEKLKQVADESGLSESSWVRQVVLAALKKCTK